jgi:hypothetical protein
MGHFEMLSKLSKYIDLEVGRLGKKKKNMNAERNYQINK